MTPLAVNAAAVAPSVDSTERRLVTCASFLVFLMNLSSRSIRAFISPAAERTVLGCVDGNPQPGSSEQRCSRETAYALVTAKLQRSTKVTELVSLVGYLAQDTVNVEDGHLEGLKQAQAERSFFLGQRGVRSALR
jgi:hypothetical protein